MKTDCINGLPMTLVRDIAPEKPTERWLIEDLWARSAVGLIGGQPKCAKTWLGLDLAVSVASGTKALDRFPVDSRGPVIVYLAEDGLPQVRARVEAICSHRGTDLETLPLAVITAACLKLDIEYNQERLTAAVEKLKPKMLLLDPLVRLHGFDENSSAEVSHFLAYFRELQRQYDVAVVLVHHASKKSRTRPGQALRGSSDLHAFGDSNAYLSRDGRDADRISLVVEHRSARPPDPMTLELRSRPDGSQTHLAIIGSGSDGPSSVSHQPALDERIVDHLNAASAPVARTALREHLRVNNAKLGHVLGDLEASGRIVRCADGWALVR